MDRIQEWSRNRLEKFATLQRKQEDLEKEIKLHLDRDVRVTLADFYKTSKGKTIHAKLNFVVQELRELTDHNCSACSLKLVRDSRLTTARVAQVLKQYLEDIGHPISRKRSRSKSRSPNPKRRRSIKFRKSTK